MIKIDKEVEIKRAIVEKNKVAIERNNIIKIEDVEDSSSSSSMSMYNLDSNRENSKVPSYRFPTLIEAPLTEHLEEIHSSLVMDKISSKRNSVINVEENPSCYSIKEIFEAFTFNIYKKDVIRKRGRNEKHNDRTIKQIQEDKVLFENTDEDHVIVAIALATLSQDTAHNVIMLNETFSQAESENTKLIDEITSLKEEMNIGERWNVA